MPYTQATAKQNAKLSQEARRNGAYSQATKLQRALANAGEELERDLFKSSDKTERTRIAGALASVAKGWQSMNDQLRVMRGVPLPGSLRPEKPSKKVSRVKASPVEEEETMRVPKEQNVSMPSELVKLNRSDQEKPATMPQDEPQPGDRDKTPPNSPQPQEGSNA